MTRHQPRTQPPMDIDEDHDKTASPDEAAPPPGYTMPHRPHHHHHPAPPDDLPRIFDSPYGEYQHAHKFPGHAFGGGRGRGWGGMHRGRGGPHAHHHRGRGSPWAGGRRAWAPPPFLAWMYGDDDNNNKPAPAEGTDFSPEIDVFETDAAYVLHAALPGARPEDVGAHWLSEGNSVRVSGVLRRPGDEALLAALAVDERGASVGVFERDIPLAEPVRADGITARLEHGLLTLEAPKEKREKKAVEVTTIQIN